MALDDESRQHADSCLIERAPRLCMRHGDGATGLSLHLYDSEGDCFYTFSHNAHQQRMLPQDSGRDVLRFGSMHVVVPDDVDAHLRAVATAALRAHLDFGVGYEDPDAVLATAEAGLLPIITGVWSRPTSEFSHVIDPSGSAVT